jgi:glycosyltransferase involved in cell wall biosynthesis
MNFFGENGIIRKVTKRKKRILIFVYEYPPLGAGVANAIYHLLKEFEKEKNLEIDLITSSLENTWSVSRLSENVSCYQVAIGIKTEDNYQSQTAKNMWLYTKNSLDQARELVKKNKYDLIHVFGYPTALQANILHRKYKIPYMISLRGVDVPGYNPRFKLIDDFYKPLISLLWRDSRRMIVNSHGLKELALKTSENLIYKIIPNGVDTKLFKKVPEKYKFKKFTITAGGTIFGKKKGLNYLIAAYAEFAKDKDDVNLLLIGAGDLEGELKKQVKDLGIKEKVDFAGYMEKSALSKNLPRCHVFCLPSINEGMSNATLEAIASTLPIILTEVGGSKELLRGNGFLIPKRNSKEITRRLELLYADDKLRKSMAKESRKIAVEMSWEKVAKMYLKEYGV